MKRRYILLSVVLLFILRSGTAAQPPSPVSGDKNLEDRDVKGRSIEMERVKRDASRSDSRQPVQTAAEQAARFEEIKEDFEQMQLAQDEILKAYLKGKTVDYQKISVNAEQVHKRGTRLNANLFVAGPQTKPERRDQVDRTKTDPPPADVKALIVEMDNTLAAFVGSPMFTDPAAASSDDNKKARSELEKLIRLSFELKREADTSLKRH